MDLSVSGISDDFVLSSRDSFVAGDQIARLPTLLRTLRDLPASVRAHEEFDPWALVTNTSPTAVHLRARVDVEGLQTQAWLNNCITRAMTQIHNLRIPVYSHPDLTWYSDLARSSFDPRNIRNVSSRLAEVGICLVVNNDFPVVKVDGAAFLLVDRTPVVALSLRYSREDHFWFTLFHELAHVRFDLVAPDQSIVDDLEAPALLEREILANDFAQQCFVSTQIWRDRGLRFAGQKMAHQLMSFAAELSISPAVLAGRLRRELNDHRLLSDIVNRTDVRELLR